jgi:2-polyprenyl-3-methyl-5-hydroxy-6-metoxy-1,4-benzoquinol methylase
MFTEFLTDYHPEWQLSRMNFLVNLYGKSYFKGKRILELGSQNGFFSAAFHSLGSEVLCVEGREDIIEEIRNRFPQLKVIQSDLDTKDWIFGKWDIIINFGLFYHLENFHKEHLINCIQNSNTMFFETVIFDSKENKIFFRRENGKDQSLTDIGGSPTEKYVQDIFEENSIGYQMYSDESLNGGSHKYDWKSTGNENFNQFYRRFWITKK